tara:strand:- start:568 stop:1326 length:759 start_codon:yes stop_codon:yes gene_type:complete
MTDTIIELLIEFSKRLFVWVINLFIALVYIVSLAELNTHLVSYSKNGQNFFSTDFSDIYTGLLLITALIVPTTLLIIHLIKKNKIDFKFIFSLKGFSINALFILSIIVFGTLKEDALSSSYNKISAQLNNENKFLFPVMDDFAYIEREEIKNIFTEISIKDKSFETLNDLVINKRHLRYVEECKGDQYETISVSLRDKEFNNFIVVDSSYENTILDFLPSGRCELKKKETKEDRCWQTALGDKYKYDRCMAM